MKQVLHASYDSIVAALKQLGFYQFTRRNSRTSYRLGYIASQIHVYLKPLSKTETQISIHEDVGLGGHVSLYDTPVLREFLRSIKNAVRRLC
ncbi:hypothetical protein KEJ26_01455 [Candidatus Bathyarchaeota archaeon]|nr:hypothetical protein [Candidatus Bathyarchaeota archaeon]